jgi:hypothetical protein
VGLAAEADAAVASATAFDLDRGAISKHRTGLPLGRPGASYLEAVSGSTEMIRPLWPVLKFTLPG